ncbi:MAG TPA: LysR family transcriptional regulator, partial [Rhodanobacteraceae bacterium]|nr:LysR family transcriptional regulator [Rhodanobacteraceae bacterium]
MDVHETDIPLLASFSLLPEGEGKSLPSVEADCRHAIHDSICEKRVFGLSGCIGPWPRRPSDMRLRYIELFHAILTTGSLTGAAKLLNISQPAASKALQHAESQLGFALFSRVRGRLQPT